MTLLLGLIAALCWGTTDLLARFSGRGLGAYRAMFFAQLPALAVMSVLLAAERDAVAAVLAGAPIAAWVAGLLAAPLVLAATLSLFRALTIGTIGIVSPVTASYGAVTALLSAAAGEKLAPLTAAGIAVTVVGVALASAPARAHPRGGSGRADPLRGVGWALLSAATYGFGLWLQGALAVPALGSLVPVWLYYVTGVIGMALLARPLRQSLAPPPLRFWGVVLGSGLLGVSAYLAFAAGLATGHVAVVTVLSSLSSGVTALLGRLVLGERLSRHQWLGVAAILLGIGLINGAR
ncbi:MAG TPA: DMT family transporter [Stellaceae bacterium]|nr:DMT family transporter [Stellaceae bacterium]